LDGENALPLSDGALYVGARGDDAAAAASSFARSPIGSPETEIRKTLT
jgi:hypothetical protein